MLEGYLGESMYINNEITCAYLKLGPNAKELMTTNTIKVYLYNINKYSVLYNIC